MAELHLVVGDGVDLIHGGNASIEVIHEGPLVSATSVFPVPRRCGWRCFQSIAVYDPRDPTTVTESRENDSGLGQFTVPPGWQVRFHHATFIGIIGESGTELTFILPGEETVIMTLE